MTTLKLDLTLPDSLAREAARLGQLEPENLRLLLSDAVRTRRMERLAEARRNVAQAGIAPLAMEEIQAEIDADRSVRGEKPVQ